MSNSDDNNYIGVLLEEIRDQYKAVPEAVGAMREQLQQIPKREEFEELKDDVKIIKATVTDLSHQVTESRRIGRVEAAA